MTDSGYHVEPVSNTLVISTTEGLDAFIRSMPVAGCPGCGAIEPQDYEPGCPVCDPF